jgi:hypothetical protein
MQIPTHSAHIKIVKPVGWNLINKYFTANFKLSVIFFLVFVLQLKIFMKSAYNTIQYTIFIVMIIQCLE